MRPIEYNLLDEPWICVVGMDCASVQVSLIDALLNAHCYTDLGGELPTQDIAILRLLLAVLHTVFSRMDENGDDSPLEGVSDALRRWQILWQRGCFPEAPIRKYLELWRDRFWLFHPERPFYQVNAAEIGTAYTSAKLNGELSESGNKVKLFPVQTGVGKERLDYAEAARWLIYQNAFDDNSSKPKGKNLPAPGIGWLGKLGLIQAVGDTLFETLMLNLCLSNGLYVWDEPNCPVWELDDPRSCERVEIAIPENQAELLTLQSRRLLLKREGGRVVGYSLLGGDFFPKENSLTETMTLWSRREDKKINEVWYQPQRHNPDRLIWQEFSTIITGKNRQLNDEVRNPGVVTWLEILQTARILPEHYMVRLRIASVQYGSSDYFATDVLSDEMALHTNLLSELGETWRAMIEGEVALCTDCAARIGWFAVYLAKAEGDVGNSETVKRRLQSHETTAKARFFAAVDMPFRAWLAELDAENGSEAMNAASLNWRDQARAIALKLGENMIARTDSTAFSGRLVKEKQNGKDVENHYSAPEAWLAFRRSIYKLYPVDNEEKR